MTPTFDPEPPRLFFRASHLTPFDTTHEKKFKNGSGTCHSAEHAKDYTSVEPLDSQLEIFSRLAALRASRREKIICTARLRAPVGSLLIT